MTNVYFNAPNEWPLSTFTIDVLFYQEGKETVALGLDVDLEGRGEDQKAAALDLLQHIEMQLGFAIQKKQPELLFKPAEAHWWKIYQETRQRALRAVVTSGHADQDPGYGAGTLPIPPQLLNAARKRKPFRRAYVS
ncbi:MAG: hypothetical protein ACRETF_01490 [Nevskiaceae bacterium]